MQVHYKIDNLPPLVSPVITIGSFDGVHKGHVAILKQLISKANELKGETVVITFHPHPRKILFSAEAPSLLSSFDERIERFSSLGIDHLVVVPFDFHFSELDAREYVEKFIIDTFSPKMVIIGFDHRFGKGRAGDFGLLKQMGEQFGFEVQEIPEELLHDSKISSTAIRNALLEGNLKVANDLLGYEYPLEGRVIRGDQLGRTIGFPTANLAITETEKLIPATGVYAVGVHIKLNNGFIHGEGMMNIGYRPTVNGKERRIEVNIFDFDQDIYEEILSVEIKAFIRKEMKFPSLDALKEQLANDRNKIKELLATLKSAE